VISVVPNWHGL